MNRFKTRIMSRQTVNNDSVTEAVRVTVGYEPALKATILNVYNVSLHGALDLLREAVRQLETEEEAAHVNG